jgi:hypothetical protein
MAAAMYIAGLCTLHSETRDQRYLDLADTLLGELERARLPGGGWGLGFQYRDLPKAEPFSITVALVARAFARHHLATGRVESLERLVSSVRWLVHKMPWAVTGGGAGPWFSPGIRDVLPNVTSMVGGVLHQAHRLTGLDDLLRPARLATAFVLYAQRSAGHWPYGYASGGAARGARSEHVVDAIHTAYVIDGLLLALESGASNADAIASSVRRGCAFLVEWLLEPRGLLLEKVVPSDLSDPRTAALAANRRLRLRTSPSGETFVVYPAESRLWGYGAAIGALSRAHRAGLCGLDPAHRMLRRLVEVHFADSSGRFRYLANDPRAFPRHEAHAFEGVSSMLSLLGDDHPPNPMRVLASRHG